MSIAVAGIPIGPIPDDITEIAERSVDDLFSLGREEVEALQLRLLRSRVAKQAPRLRALQERMETTKVNKINVLEDVIPLLFADSVYKSYPLEYIENAEFGKLTEWLGSYTTLDLAAVDTAACDGIDSWLDALDAQTALRVIHTSGTTGKLSFIPRSTLEIETWFKVLLKNAQAFGSGDWPVLVGEGSERVPALYPFERYGRLISIRSQRVAERILTPSPRELYTLREGHLSADVISLLGRIRMTLAKGETVSMTIPEKPRADMREYLTRLQSRPEDMFDMLIRVSEELQGKPVLYCGNANILYHGSMIGLERGYRGIFSPESMVVCGGGSKGTLFPDNWIEAAREFTGISHWNFPYAMSEMVGGAPQCDFEFYHVPPYQIPFVFDLEADVALPREGIVTGRFAVHDLLAQTSWGGIITGDRATVDFSGECPCGRKGPRVYKDVARHTVGGSGWNSSISASTADNDAALMRFLDS